jgi:hypothetical protein
LIAYIDGRIHDAPEEDAHLLLDELKRLARPDLYQHWAKSVFNYITVASYSSRTARDLLDELKRVSTEHPDETELRQVWANSVVNYLGRATQDEPAQQRYLLDELKRVSRTHPDEHDLCLG